MSLTAAMLTGFTGIEANSVAVDVVGHNLANLNTTAFKSQRTLFETLLYDTVHEGTAPSAESGGTLPEQIGRGTQVSVIQRDVRPGSLLGTGFPSDLAVDGIGYFVLQRPVGDQVYARDGAFRLDAAQTLVSADGFAVRGYAADPTGVIQPGPLSNLVIPRGSTGPATPTANAVMDGRLDSSNTNIAATGAVVVSDLLVTASGVAATASTPLTGLVNQNGIALFADGDELSIQASKGGVATSQETFIVGTTGSTVGDLAGFLTSMLGLDTDPTTGGGADVSVGDGTAFPAGALVVQSNPGEVNAVEMDAGSIVNQTGAIRSPFAFDTVSAATGQGVTTSFVVFDSLGNPVDVRLRASLESISNSGSTWRYYAESVDDSDLSPLLGTGTISFDANGQFVAATGTDLSIDLAGSGAGTPLGFTLDLSSLNGLAGADGTSQLIMASQDGSPAGVLTGFSIDRDGVITAAFSNQTTQVLGQVVLATFPNEEGLVAFSDNVYGVGPNSGSATIVAPQTAAAGAVIAGALEESNVEIAREFISLITASTGISSASRVVRVADDLLQELLLLAR